MELGVSEEELGDLLWRGTVVISESTRMCPNDGGMRGVELRVRDEWKGKNNSHGVAWRLGQYVPGP